MTIKSTENERMAVTMATLKYLLLISAGGKRGALLFRSTETNKKAAMITAGRYQMNESPLKFLWLELNKTRKT